MQQTPPAAPAPPGNGTTDSTYLPILLRGSRRVPNTQDSYNFEYKGYDYEKFGLVMWELRYFVEDFYKDTTVKTDASLFVKRHFDSLGVRIQYE